MNWLHDAADMYRQKQESGDWILRVLDPGGQNIRLGKVEFINVRALYHDTGFDILARTINDGASIPLEEPLEAWKEQ